MIDMRLSAIMILSAAFTVMPLTVNAQEKGYGAYRTGSWSLYGEGGATRVHGLGMQDVKAAPFTDVSPEFGLGVSYNIRPWVRLGLNYDWSGFAREQRLDRFVRQYAKSPRQAPNKTKSESGAI